MVNMRTQKVKEFDLDLSGVCSYEDGAYDGIILGGLRSEGFLGGNIYSVFDFDRVDGLRETGCATLEALERGILYGFRKEELVWDDGSAYCLRNYAEDYWNSGIAIYDSTRLTAAYENVDSKYAYEFRDKDNKAGALVGIAKLILP